ncbi:MAG TPA: AmmeMemoRadiSam system protein B [Candidatus Limnocylindrales bacterium]
MTTGSRDRHGRRREPAVAGSFYPADPARLARDVGRLLDRAAETTDPTAAEGGGLLGLLVPHAGLAYSGAVAAIGWSRLATSVARDGDVTILLAGTNHLHPFVGVAVWSGGPWRTPLGDVSVDAPWSDALLELGDPFGSLDRAHGREHSIEVQLPLVARALPEARFVPFLVSLGDLDGCIEAGRRLGRLVVRRRAELGPVAIVASSDLAHYPPDDVARRVDATMLEPIASLDPGGLAARELEIRGAGLPGLACGLCGIEPTLLAVSALAELGATRGLVLAHATSADVPEGDADRVVGYAAVVFVG